MFKSTSDTATPSQISPGSRSSTEKWFYRCNAETTFHFRCHNDGSNGAIFLLISSFFTSYHASHCSHHTTKRPIWYLSAHIANSRQKIKQVSEVASLCHSTSPAARLYACLPLSFSYSPCTSKSCQSAYTLTLGYPLSQKVNSTNDVKQVHSPAF